MFSKSLIDDLKKQFRNEDTSVFFHEKEDCVEISTPKMFNFSVASELTEEAGRSIKVEIKSRGLTLSYFSAEDGVVRFSVDDMPIGFLGGALQGIPQYKGSLKIVDEEILELDVEKAFLYKETLKARKESFHRGFKENLKKAISRSLVPKDTAIKMNEDMNTGKISYCLYF